MNEIFLAVDPMADNGWVSYTAGLTLNLAGLDASLHLVSPEEAPEGAPCIFYGVAPTRTPHIYLPRREQLTPGKMAFIELDCGFAQSVPVLVYEGTLDGEADAATAKFPCDLLFNLFAYVSCLEEVRHEARFGPLHSYAVRLKTDSRRFRRPYAHYLALALRCALEKLWPVMPVGRTKKPAIHLTHDVDLTEKVFVTRAKEGAFRMFNTGRYLVRGNISGARKKLGETARMVFREDDYFLFDEIASLEAEFGFCSTFNVYAPVSGGGLGESITRWLFDPPYDPADHPRLASTLHHLVGEGWEIGVHFGFTSWRHAEQMREEREKLEYAMGKKGIISSRQHWLRFSHSETWHALWESGMRVDTTLGFNDVPGFRGGLALPFHPYDHVAKKAHPIISIPTILMDTHLFYYGNLEAAERLQTMETFLEEVRFVGGEACIIWHSHTLSRDHGWGQDYRSLLEIIRRGGFSVLTPSHHKEGCADG